MSNKLPIACLMLVFAATAHAQRFEPTWESVDSRPTPAWWGDAKFGIFIHWGVFSVPAYAPKGEYAEWYWERLRKPGNPDASTNDAKIRRETREFHADKVSERRLAEGIHSRLQDPILVERDVLQVACCRYDHWPLSQ